MAINTTSIQARELLAQDYTQELAVKNAMAIAPAAATTGAATTQTGTAAAAVQPSAATTQALTSAATQAASGQQQTTPAAQTAQQQAAQAEQAAQERFNAPVLRLPARPTTHAVLRGLATAMANPKTNDATAERLKEFHDEMFAAEKAMIGSIVDGMNV